LSIYYIIIYSMTKWININWSQNWFTTLCPILCTSTYINIMNIIFCALLTKSVPHGPFVAVCPLDQRALSVFGYKSALHDVCKQHVIRAHRHSCPARPMPVIRQIVRKSRHVHSPATIADSQVNKKIIRCTMVIDNIIITYNNWFYRFVIYF